MSNAGVWSVVLRVFDDGSAVVRVGEGSEEGHDQALASWQVPPDLQPGDAGRLVQVGEQTFFRLDQVRGVPPGYVWRSVTMALPNGDEILVDGWGPPNSPSSDRPDDPPAE